MSISLVVPCSCISCLDGGVSYILVHQTGLADTAIAEDDNLFAVRPSRDTGLSVSLEVYLQQLLARGHVVGWDAWRETSMLWIVCASAWALPRRVFTDGVLNRRTRD
jgi:hypothetical protein